MKKDTIFFYLILISMTLFIFSLMKEINSDEKNEVTYIHTWRIAIVYTNGEKDTINFKSYHCKTDRPCIMLDNEPHREPELKVKWLIFKQTIAYGVRRFEILEEKRDLKTL